MKINTKGMDKILRMLENNLPEIKVGILGDKDNREDGSNATIGAYHEFGTENTPQRSFLRMPLNEKFDEYLEKSGLLDKDTIKKVIKDGNFVKLAKNLGIIAESVIIDAFDTGGFGKWEPSEMKNKKNHQTLIESQQLRNSIISKVESSND